MPSEGPPEYRPADGQPVAVQSFELQPSEEPRPVGASRLTSRSPGWWALRVALPVAVVAVVAAVFTIRDGDEIAAEGDRSTSSTTAATSTTTESTTTTTTTTTTMPPTTTEAPTTTAAPPPPPVTEAPAPPPPPVSEPPPAPRAPGPISMLVVGDSTGFTASFPLPNSAERPGYVTRIETAAVLSCGVLSVLGYTAVDVENDGADAFGLCHLQAQKELSGLATRPNWMVLFSGGWEHLPWLPPGATEPLPARSPELRAAILNELVRRANGAASFGTRTAFVAWACPSGVSPTRTGDYIKWYNDILSEAVGSVPGSMVVWPTERVCAGGDPAGFPTGEKNAAFADGYHPVDKRWLWQDWLGPAIHGQS